MMIFIFFFLSAEWKSILWWKEWLVRITQRKCHSWWNLQTEIWTWGAVKTHAEQIGRCRYFFMFMFLYLFWASGHNQYITLELWNSCWIAVPLDKKTTTQQQQHLKIFTLCKNTAFKEGILKLYGSLMQWTIFHWTHSSKLLREFVPEWRMQH